jgi:hypothetical protein
MTPEEFARLDDKFAKTYAKIVGELIRELQSMDFTKKEIISVLQGMNMPFNPLYRLSDGN